MIKCVGLTILGQRTAGGIVARLISGQSRRGLGDRHDSARSHNNPSQILKHLCTPCIFHLPLRTPTVSTTNTNLDLGATAIEDKLQEKVPDSSMQATCSVSQIYACPLQRSPRSTLTLTQTRAYTSILLARRYRRLWRPYARPA